MPKGWRGTGALGWGLAFVLVAAAMLWPAAIYGRPSYYFDSEGYFANGRAAAFAVKAKLEHALFPKPGDQAGADARSKTAKDVVATRSVPYAVFAYLTSWPYGTMVMTIVVQAMVLSAVLLIWWRQVASGLPWQAALLASLVLAASSAPWFASFVMPDIFAGAGLLALLTMALPAPRPLSLPVKTFLMLVIAFAFAAHASNMPLLLAVCGLAALHELWLAWRSRQAPRLGAMAWFAAPVVLGAAVVVVTSLVGFAEVSLAPKRLPLVLARSIADGPGRLYLQKHCADEKWTVCDVMPVFPKKQAEILFGPNGIRTRATPAQMDAIRKEEAEIVRRAMREYPLQQAAVAARNYARQLFAWGLWDNEFKREVELHANGAMVLRTVPHSERPLALGDALSTALVIVSGVYLIMLAPRMRRGELVVALIAVIGLLVNAFVTGVLSSVANRYQGRLIWVLPALALGFWLARRRTSEAVGADGS